MLKTLLTLAAAVLSACGGGSDPADPLGSLRTPTINDGAAFNIPAGGTLQHQLLVLDYVNYGEPVDLVVTMRSTETLAGGTGGAAVSMALASGSTTTANPTHVAPDGQHGSWVECVELRTRAGSGQSVSIAGMAVLAGSGTLDSKGVVVEAVIYPAGRAPGASACAS